MATCSTSRKANSGIWGCSSFLSLSSTETKSYRWDLETVLQLWRLLHWVPKVADKLCKGLLVDSARQRRQIIAVVGKTVSQQYLKSMYCSMAACRSHWDQDFVTSSESFCKAERLSPQLCYTLHFEWCSASSFQLLWWSKTFWRSRAVPQTRSTRYSLMSSSLFHDCWKAPGVGNARRSSELQKSSYRKEQERYARLRPF